MERRQGTVRVGSLIPNQSQPRTHFDSVGMEELRASVKEHGILQPILVRMHDDGATEIIAGERRWRAARAEFGDDYEIPAQILVGCSDEEAEEAATIENIQREQMSPTEEAAAFAKMLPKHGGNRDELARRLSISRAKLDKRLALMNCAQAVRDALTKRLITLGHAELFAAAPKDKQEKALEAMLQLPKLPTVEELRMMVAQISKTLSVAIFAKEQCASCEHNSSNQKALFGESIDEGYCTDSACFTHKTEAALEGIAASLHDEYPRVVIVRPGDNNTAIKLIADGPTGVGAAQAEACRACANFGAAVLALPGHEGQVKRNQCFDTPCNASKVADARKAEKAEAAAAAEKDASAQEKGAKEGAQKKAGATPRTPTKATSIALSNGVKEWRGKFWRGSLKQHIQDADQASQLRVCIALAVSGQLAQIDKADMASGLQSATKATGVENAHHDVAQAFQLACAIPDARVVHWIVPVLCSCIDKIEESNVVTLLHSLQVDVSKYVKKELLASFFNTLTKSEIEFAAAQIGIKRAMGSPAFSKLGSLKKDELIQKVTNVDGFEYDGKLPSVLEPSTK